MAYQNGAQAYRKNATLSASPVQLVIMLYDGALRFMEEGKRAMVAKDYETQNTKLQKAQKIVIELTSSLDFARGGDISKNLFNLYMFVIDEMVAGNIEDNPSRIDNAMKTMSDLREGWIDVERQVKENPGLIANAA